ncbi:MAG: hypothetical protein KDA69_10020 [Planctomycetaceae bacterium]|nr:hypothetical protein [Planctomycetaceae bacterium]
MDAPSTRLMFAIAILCVASTVSAATVRTRNFIVTAATDEIAQKAAKAAEFWRKELSEQWLAQEMPPWKEPCPIKVNVGRIGASGATTFSFDNGQVFGWNMEVNGSLERILDSVIPHEVNHTILASYFKRPLPRWADEGAATLVEADCERAVQARTLNQVLKNNQRIPLRNLLNIKEYPNDKMQVYALYAEGYALADYLVQQHGEQGRYVYLHFLQLAHEQGWEAAIRKYYNFKGIDDLEQHWGNWVMAGSPRLQPEGEMLADAGQPESATPNPGMEYRGQSPDELQPLAMIPRPLRQTAKPRKETLDPTSGLAPDVPELPAPLPIPTRPASSGEQSPEWTQFPEKRSRIQ